MTESSSDRSVFLLLLFSTIWNHACAKLTGSICSTDSSNYLDTNKQNARPWILGTNVSLAEDGSDIFTQFCDFAMLV